MARDTRDWESIRAEKPLDESLVARWDWLDEAMDQLADAAHAHGISTSVIGAAYERAEIAAAGVADEDVLTELTGFVSALGGRIEDDADGAIAAVLGDGIRIVLGTPPRV